MSDETRILARSIRFRNVGLQTDALSPELKRQAELLDEDEIKVLEAIKMKLNRNLPDNLKAAADTVGGFVW